MIRRTARVLSLAALAATLGAVAAAEEWRIPAETNFLTGYPGLNEDGSVNMVVEIPAGTNAKWETTETGDALEWRTLDSGRRVVDYLAYPGNYGMIPSTRLPKRLGGDDEPLDVVLLGPAVARGKVVRVRPVGVLRLLDDGERDDKIVAVPLEGPFADVEDLSDLDDRYPGARSILETWFVRHQGSGRTKSKGFADQDEAMEIVEAAAAVFASEVTSGS